MHQALRVDVGYAFADLTENTAYPWFCQWAPLQMGGHKCLKQVAVSDEVCDQVESLGVHIEFEEPQNGGVVQSFELVHLLHHHFKWNPAAHGRFPINRLHDSDCTRLLVLHLCHDSESPLTDDLHSLIVLERLALPPVDEHVPAERRRLELVQLRQEQEPAQLFKLLSGQVPVPSCVEAPDISPKEPLRQLSNSEILGQPLDTLQGIFKAQ
mmetsp:Transcript_104993/g.306752  ORF Transcript_104993/g.306752 Transcript_104993/m.306752 type:complete len:211 (-) Transcript_104993:753-1385(-)